VCRPRAPRSAFWQSSFCWKAIITSKPLKVSDWIVGEPLAFLIQAARKRIYIDSGGVPGAPPHARIRNVDLAILGVALPDSRERFAEAVRQLRPHFILPSHQDDMFAPPDREFCLREIDELSRTAARVQKQRVARAFDSS
jgi:hypothetical protein